MEEPGYKMVHKSLHCSTLLLTTAYYSRNLWCGRTSIACYLHARWHTRTSIVYCSDCYAHAKLSFVGGTAAAAPPPFRPGNPALCGSRPLVIPYYCRLGDLLCLFVYPLFVYYFVCLKTPISMPSPQQLMRLLPVWRPSRNISPPWKVPDCHVRSPYSVHQIHFRENCTILPVHNCSAVNVINQCWPTPPWNLRVFFASVLYAMSIARPSSVCPSHSGLHYGAVTYILSCISHRTQCKSTSHSQRTTTRQSSEHRGLWINCSTPSSLYICFDCLQRRQCRQCRRYLTDHCFVGHIGGSVKPSL